MVKLVQFALLCATTEYTVVTEGVTKILAFVLPVLHRKPLCPFVVNVEEFPLHILMLVLEIVMGGHRYVKIALPSLA